MQAEELHEKLKNVDIGVCDYTLDKCRELVPVIERINALKKRRNAIVLAHTYVLPEIIFGVGDFVGDSYYLADMARKSEAQVIVFAAVHFMAETAKILNPGKIVLHPNLDGGCTLAESITGAEVRELRRQHPEHVFVCYINTSADVKAACDVCVTSSNVYSIVENLDADKIYFLPDRLMAQNLIQHLVERGVKKEVLTSAGVCYVHEGYEPEMIDYARVKHGKLAVAVHPECSPAVVARADYVGSTSGIYNYVKNTAAERFLLVTECGLGSRIRAELPGKRIIGSCTFCRYMQGNSLALIEEALLDESGRYEVTLDERVRRDAERCIQRMFEEVARIPKGS